MLEKLKNQPVHARKQFAFSFSLITFLIIFFVWLSITTRGFDTNLSLNSPETQSGKEVPQKAHIASPFASILNDVSSIGGTLKSAVKNIRK